ncbi:hypothetical protein SAMN05216188_11394 [Lentzea xinjiangensis]|uniref:Uncharacterized protein n=2 Tax=Lentzea xinjiangensis TaxID=402600 RepID=A0A1H9QKT4_9PSEU|nr:hypothetical protein SAMN05216188_11394 [Lentzea xinjiangensis]
MPRTKDTTSQLSPDRPGESVENPTQAVDDASPIHPGDEISEALQQENPDAATSDHVNHAVEASASDDSGSTTPDRGSSSAAAASGERSTANGERPGDSRNSTAGGDNGGGGGGDNGGGGGSGGGDRGDGGDHEDKGEKADKEAAADYLTQFFGEMLAKVWDGFGQLNDSGAMGKIGESLAEAYKSGGLEAAKNIANGWVAGLKKGLAEKDSSPASQEFKDQAEAMADRLEEQGEAFKDRAEAMADRLKEQGEAFKRDVEGRTSPGAGEVSPSESREAPPPTPPDDENSR